MEDVNKLILVACLTGLPLVAIAKQSKEPAFVPAPMTEVDVIPGRPWDGKGAAEFRGPFADALKSLLAAGLPDPTGLPYRKLSIPTGNCYTGDDGVQETEAWLLPDEGQNGARV